MGNYVPPMPVGPVDPTDDLVPCAGCGQIIRKEDAAGTVTDKQINIYTPPVVHYFCLPCWQRL